MFCPNCKKEIKENWKFCNFCGVILSNAEELQNTNINEEIEPKINEIALENNNTEEINPENEIKQKEIAFIVKKQEENSLKIPIIISFSIITLIILIALAISSNNKEQISVNSNENNQETSNEIKQADTNNEPTKAIQSELNDLPLTERYTSSNLNKADLAWHASNTYGWDCQEVVEVGESNGEYYNITCSSGLKLRVYPRVNEYPKITNEYGTYEDVEVNKENVSTESQVTEQSTTDNQTISNKEASEEKIEPKIIKKERTPLTPEQEILAYSNFLQELVNKKWSENNIAKANKNRIGRAVIGVRIDHRLGLEVATNPQNDQIIESIALGLLSDLKLFFPKPPQSYDGRIIYLTFESNNNSHPVNTIHPPRPPIIGIKTIKVKNGIQDLNNNQTLVLKQQEASDFQANEQKQNLDIVVPYLRYIQKRIYNNFIHTLTGKHFASSKYKIVLDRQGNALSKKIVIESDNTDFNNIARNALDASLPFEPIISTYTKDKIEFIVTFSQKNTDISVQIE